MSVYRPKATPFYHFDFKRGGHRFCGTTGCTGRREAEQVERAEIAKAVKQQKQARNATVSMQLDVVIDRYWVEVGQHHSGSDNTWRDLCRLADYFPKTQLLTEIKDADVATLVAWRRAQKVHKEPIAAATVNRSTTEVLKKLFTRAKTAWGVRFDHEPRWRSHMLTESAERVRELNGTEWAKLTAAMRPDYAPYFNFAHASGARLSECLLRWREVDLGQSRIVKPGKGKKLVTIPITTEIRKIIELQQGHHPEFVFTYRHGKEVKRSPLTKSGVKTEWKRLRARAGIKDFRQHDLRHDLATKLLRETGNLKLVQRALNHADLKTTLRYAHVLDSEVATALENVSSKRKA